MIRKLSIPVLCLLLCCGFAPRRTPPEATQGAVPDSLAALWHYTEGIKRLRIEGDTLAAKESFAEALAADSAYAPAYFELATLALYRDNARAAELAGRAHRIDTANKWYLRYYGQALVMDGRYDRALDVYRRLCRTESRNPDNYRLLSLLHEQKGDTAEALSVLDSAELRFGKIPLLSMHKRRLLIADKQYDRALSEAEAMVDAAPYEPENRVVLAEVYAATGRDSLARAEFGRALEIDSTNLSTLISLADYYNRKRDYPSYLNISRMIFANDELPLEEKTRIFRQLTGDLRFYREFYPYIHTLAVTLSMQYPDDKRVVELFGGHLIASGETEQALSYFKSHLGDTPPQKEYYAMVVDIESYLQRPDSVDLYLGRALALFPDDAQLRLRKAHSLAFAREYGKAVGAYREALRYVASDSLRSAVWGFIGDVYQQQGMGDSPTTEKAFEKGGGNWKKYMKRSYDAYDRALKLDRNNVAVLNNYAYFLSLEGRDLERALEMSSRVLALTDNNPTYLDTHAWVLFRLGRLEEAKKFMQQAVSLDGQQSPELQVHYGDILAALGENFMAQTYWERALKNGYDPDEIARRIEALKATSKP